MKIELVRGDITKQRVDAIVNAANSTLLGGGGVDGAIHRAAGPELLDACRALGGCAPGDAKITRGFRLPAKFVIHTVGPVWQGGSANEAELLARCYSSSLRVADDQGCQTVAFPAISCGAYGYPLPQAAAIAVKTVRTLGPGLPSHLLVRWVLFGDSAYQAWFDALSEVDNISNPAPPL